MANAGVRVVKLDNQGEEIERVYLTGSLETSRIEVIKGEVSDSSAQTLTSYIGNNYSETYAINPLTGARGSLMGWAVDMGEHEAIGLRYHRIIELNADGRVRRDFGVDTDGKEIISFYRRPQITNGTRVDGEVVINLGERTAEGLSLKRKYYYTNTNFYTRNGSVLTLDNQDEVVAWSEETSERIEGHEDWTIVKELSPGRETVLATRATDVLGREVANIACIPADEYMIDLIEYSGSEEIGRTSYIATKEGLNYVLGNKISTFRILSGTELDTVLAEFTQARIALGDKDLSSYGQVGTFNNVLEGLRQELGVDNFTFRVGRLHKENDGDCIIFRLEGDYLARVIAQNNSDGTLSVNLSWDENGQPNKSIITIDGQVYSSSSSSAATISDVFEGDLRRANIFENALINGQRRVARINSSISVLGLNDLLLKYGIAPEMKLVRVNVVYYERRGSSGNLSFADRPVSETELYLIPGDPAGRTLFERRHLSNGEIITMNMWNWDKVVNSPFGILPGAISVRIIEGKGYLNRVRARTEEAKLFDRRLTVNNIGCYAYTIINGGYKVGELFAESGQLYREEFRKARSPLIKSLYNNERYLFYNLNVPFRRPLIVARDQEGKRIIEECVNIEYASGIENQLWRVNSGLKGNKLSPLNWLRVFHEYETENRYYSANGESIIMPVRFISFGKAALLVSLLALWPLALLLWSLWSGSRWQKWADNRKSNREGLADTGLQLYDEDIERVEHELFNEKVLETKNPSSGRTFNANAKDASGQLKTDSSSIFIKSLKRVRILIIAGTHKLGGIAKGDLKSCVSIDYLHRYTASVADYAGRHYSKGLVKLLPISEGKPKKVSIDTPYDEIGYPDEEIWDKLELYFFNIEHQLRKALKDNDRKRFDEIINNSGIASGVFNIKHFREFLKGEGCILLDKEITPEVKGLMAKLRAKINKDNKGEIEVTDDEYAILKDYLDSFRIDRWKRVLGIGERSIPPYLTEASKYLPFVLMHGLATVAIYGWVMGGSAVSVITMLFIPYIISAIALVLLFNSIYQYMQMSRLRFEANNVFRVVAPVTLGLATLLFIFLPFNPVASSFAPFMLKTLIVTTLYVEGITNLIFGRSLVGISLYRNFKPSIGIGRARTVILQISKYAIAMGIGLTISWFSMPWIYGHFVNGLILRALIGIYAGLGLFTYLMEYGSWGLTTFLSTIIYKEEHGPIGKNAVKTSEIEEFIKRGDLVVINYVGHPLDSKNARDINKMISCLEYLINNRSTEVKTILDEVRTIVNNSALTDNEVINIIKQALESLIAKENQHKKSLYSLAQIEDQNVPVNWKMEITDAQERTMLRIAHEVRRHLIMTHTALWPFDTAINLMDLAAKLKKEGLGQNVLLVPTPNQYSSWWGVDGGPNYEELSELFQYVSGGSKLYTTMDCNPSTLKSGAMHGMFMLPHEIVKRMRILVVIDRNANSLDLDRWVFDLKRMISNPNIAIMPAMRNTTNILMPIGNMSWLVEGGHGYAMLGWNDKIGTGWENMMRMLDQGPEGYLAALRSADCPVMPLTRELREIFPYADYKNWYRFGLIGLGPHTPHQSEDFTDVMAQTHNMIALGMRPNFALSTALAFKIRETYSTAELENAVPRWSWGLTQTFWSFIFQVINDYGPESIFERDARRDNARFYVVMPPAFVGLFLIPLGIILDILPFTGLGIVFLVIGTLFNQVSTLNGLGAHMRAASGVPSLFRSKNSAMSMIRGIAGLSAGILIGQFLFGGIMIPIALGIYGFFLFSSFLGFSRWLSQRPRDILLFAHRVAFEAIAQFRSYAGVGYIFATSGAGDHTSSNVLERMNKSKNRDSIYRLERKIGIYLTLFNLLAFMVGLDLTNAVFLFISTFFGVSMIIGPFVCENKPGTSIGSGIKQGSLQGFLRGWGDRLVNVLGLISSIGLIWILNIKLAGASTILGTFLSPLLLFALPLYLAVTIIAYVVPKYNPNPNSLHGKIVGYLIKNIPEANWFKAHPRIQRAVWEFSRFVVIGLTASMFFGIVPLPDYFLMSLGSTILKVTMSELIAGFAGIFGLIMATIILGKIYGAYKLNKFNFRYIQFVKDFESIRESLDFELRSTIEARKQQIRIFFHQEAYKYIEEALGELESSLTLSRPESAVFLLTNFENMLNTQEKSSPVLDCLRKKASVLIQEKEKLFNQIRDGKIAHPQVRINALIKNINSQLPYARLRAISALININNFINNLSLEIKGLYIQSVNDLENRFNLLKEIVLDINAKEDAISSLIVKVIRLKELLIEIKTALVFIQALPGSVFLRGDDLIKDLKAQLDLLNAQRANRQALRSAKNRIAKLRELLADLKGGITFVTGLPAPVQQRGADLINDINSQLNNLNAQRANRQALRSA
ncbi:MAG: hypothetical protein PHP89_05080, partial [Candidatus Omnitrophica bacterium]|nr:hypothetical protein [Candidatus Omnitrophota bacterium]